MTSTENVRNFDDLPENARKYVELIEDKLGLPGIQLIYLSFLLFSETKCVPSCLVRWIGVGKDRGSMIQLY